MSDSGLLFPGISNPYICYADQNFDVDPKINFATKIPELFMTVWKGSTLDLTNFY